MKKFIMAMMAVAITFGFSCCTQNNNEPSKPQESIRDTVAIKVSIAMDPTAMQYYNVYLSYTNPNGEAMKVPVAESELKAFDCNQEWTVALTEMIKAFHEEQAPAIIQRLRVYELKEEKVADWTTSAHFIYEPKADADKTSTKLDAIFYAHFESVGDVYLQSGLSSFRSLTVANCGLDYSEETIQSLATVMTNIELFSISFHTGYLELFDK